MSSSCTNDIGTLARYNRTITKGQPDLPTRYASAYAVATFSISGASSHSLTAGVTGLRVTITAASPFGSVGRSNPAARYDQGLIRFSDGTAFWDAVAVTGGPQFIPVPANATSMSYAMLNGATASVTEVIGGTVFFSSQAGLLAGLSDVSLASPVDGQLLRYNGSSAKWENAHVAQGPVLTPPAPVASWALVNSSGVTAVDTVAPNGITLVSTTGQQHGLFVAAPATPYTITAFIIPLVDTSADVGLAWRNSGAGSLVVFSPFYADTTNGALLLVDKYTSPSAFSAHYVNRNWTGIGGPKPQWLRIADNGTSRICSGSNDGKTFFTYHTIGRTDFLTADQVGFTVFGPAISTLLSWKVT